MPDGRPQTSLYDSDYAAWLERQRAALAEGRFDSIDRDNLAEELKDMGNSERDAVQSHMAVLMEYFLKLQFSPDAAPRNGWLRTVREQRRQLDRKLKRSPSLKPFAERCLAECYADARGDAALDPSVTESALPAECPYSLDQLRDPGFLPPDTAVRSG